MSFYLYTIHDKQLVRERELLYGVLWGRDGAVATCGRSKVLPNCGGPWCVTEIELLRHMKDQHQSVPDFGNDEPGNPKLVQYAIIDDLVPRGPDIAMARIKRIRGFLDPPYPRPASDPNNTDDRYNPFIVEMEEVLSVPYWDAPKEPAERDEVKRTISIRPGEVIRSISYFRMGWTPAGRFNAALLWPRHWNCLGRNVLPGAVPESP
jgi:hypothetical protein